MPIETSEVTQEDELLHSMVGQMIVRAEWIDPVTSSDWTGHEYALITLDDGRLIRFGGWGHDAWGATVGLSDEALDDPDRVRAKELLERRLAKDSTEPA